MNEDKPKWWTFFAWSVVGAGLPFLFVAYLNRSGPRTLCHPYGNGEECTIEKGPWLYFILGIALVVTGVVLFIRLRRKVASGVAIWTIVGSIVAIIVCLAWLKFHVDPMALTESKGVQQGFQQMSLTVSNKEGVPTPWLVPMHAGVASYSDGSKASLWVPKSSPQGNRSSCFYVDQPRKGGASGFYDSLCSVPKSEVILERQGLVVVGYVRMTKAHFATISSGGITVDAPITFGYFIFPSVVSEDQKAKFAISFIDPGGATCKVADLPAPGSSASVECVIA